MNTLPAEVDVVVVGGGPTGLTLACMLAAKRIPYLLLDRQAEGANTSRAAVIHAHTLEVLEALHVTARLHAEGHVVSRFVLRDRDRVLGSVSFAGLPTRYPYALMIPQSATERILAERLRELGGQVNRQYDVTNIRQNPGGVSVMASGPDGSAHTVNAQYVVGADGMHSAVRQIAGIGFIGDSYEQSFILADVRMRWTLSHSEVFLFLSPDGMAVVAPLPGGSHRLVATVNDAPEHPALSDIQHLLDTRGPVTTPAHIDQVVWSSRFRVHHRIADQYRAGRILLAGDAAHVHSPAGGQGMNTGIQDGAVLGQLLGAVLCGRAPDTLLDEYERTRRPIAARVVSLTDRMTRMATVQALPVRLLRNAAIGTIGSIPSAGRWLAMELSGIRNRTRRSRRVWEIETAI